MQMRGERGPAMLVRRSNADASWSPNSSGLIVVEDFGKAPRFNFEKISSEEIGRCVLAVVQGWCIGMDATNVMLIQPVRRGRMKRRAPSPISVVLAA